MTKYMQQALREWNNDQPSWKPVLNFEQLTPAAQSVVEDRAEQLEVNDVVNSVLQAKDKEPFWGLEESIG
jgi:hypothetical protein